MKQISLENFNPKSNKEPVINSPRSLEACRRQGILPNELVIRTLDEIKTIYGDSKLDREGLELLGQHYEERRREKIRVLLEEREQIMEDERNGIVSFSPNQEGKSKSMMSSVHNKSNYNNSIVQGSQVDSTLIEREKRQLEKIKLRQEKEIQQMMDYETKMMEIKQTQEQKLESQMQKEKRRERELQNKRKEAEQQKYEQEQEKKRRAEEEEERRRQLAAEEYRREQMRAEQEKERERQRKIEARKRDEEAKAKHEEFVRQTEEKLYEQQLLVEQKKMEMEEKDRIRQENMKIQRAMQIQEAEEKRLYHEEKLRQAKEKNDEIILQKKMEYEERQAKNEEKRKQFERELEYKKYENKMKAQEKSETIKQVLEENKHMEEKKREDFYYKKMLAEERKKELDAIAAIERRERIQAEKNKDNQRKHVKSTMEKRLEERVNGYLYKMAESDEKVMRVQKEKESMMRQKHALELIKKNDKHENVQRIARMQEYQKEKLMEKINHDTDRATQIKNEKDSLLSMRMNIRREMEGSKRSIMEKFEQVKRGKLDAETVSGEFGVRSQSMMHSQQQPRLHTTSQRSTKNSMNRGGINSAGSSKMRQPGSGLKESGKKNEARKAIENLKIKQNHEMLSLLEEEQNRENERELKLQGLNDPKEKERLEKSFAMERARAHARIQQLADSHDDSIRQLMSKYNMKVPY